MENCHRSQDRVRLLDRPLLLRYRVQVEESECKEQPSCQDTDALGIERLRIEDVPCGLEMEPDPVIRQRTVLREPSYNRDPIGIVDARAVFFLLC